MQPPFFRYQLQYWLQTQFQTQFQTQLRRVELERPRIERALGMQMSSDACSASTRIGSAGRCRRLRRPERPRSHRDCRIARDCVPLIGFLPVLPAGCAVFCSFFPSSCLSFLRVRLPILLSLFASLRLSLSLLVSPCLSAGPPVRRSDGSFSPPAPAAGWCSSGLTSDPAGRAESNAPREVCGALGGRAPVEHIEPSERDRSGHSENRSGRKSPISSKGR